MKPTACQPTPSAPTNKPRHETTATPDRGTALPSCAGAAANRLRHLSALDRAIAIDGTYAPAHWRRGLWLLDTSRPDDAHPAFEKAVALDAANPGGWFGLARVALHRRQEADAVELLERYLSQHPGDRYALRLLGTAYQRLGRTEEAEYALSVGATGEPVWPDPWTDAVGEFRVGFAQTLKAATAQLMAGQFDAAIPVLERLLRERPDEVSLMHQLGLSYVAAGRAPEGVALLERALARDDANLESHLRLATAYLNLQDYSAGAHSRKPRRRAQPGTRPRARGGRPGAVAKRAAGRRAHRV